MLKGTFMKVSDWHNNAATLFKLMNELSYIMKSNMLVFLNFDCDVKLFIHKLAYIWKLKRKMTNRNQI